MRRFFNWLIPELANFSETERRIQDRSMAAAWIGAVGLALIVTFVEMGLDAVATDGLRTMLRPLVFTLVTLSCTAVVMRASYRQSATFFREQALLTQALEHQALFDGLTELPNRRQFHDRLQRLLETSRPDQAGFALLVMDLDGFKDINDTLGHAVGDVLLQEIASRLQSELPTQDMVARLGGDEFVVILADQPRASVAKAAHRLLDAVAMALPLDGHVVQVSASIGIALYPEHGRNGDLLLRRADLAMYAAKRTGNSYVLYTPDLEPAEYPAVA
jgi:diguanylate cyclase (GGDEF)-like protein